MRSALVTLLLAAASSVLGAQTPTKVTDSSVIVTVNATREETLQRVVAAFGDADLMVTDASPEGVVRAREGSKTDGAIYYVANVTGSTPARVKLWAYSERTGQMIGNWTLPKTRNAVWEHLVALGTAIRTASEIGAGVLAPGMNTAATDLRLLIEHTRGRRG